MGRSGQTLIEGIHTVAIRKAGKPIKWYVYAWRGGPCIAKREGGTKPVLSRAEIDALNSAVQEAHSPKSGTLLSLARQWRGDGADKAGVEWKALAPSTRETWGLQLDLIEAKWGDTPLSLWSDARMVTKVIAWRDSRAATPRSADIGVTVLKALLDFAKLRARVTMNVAADVPQIYKGADRAEIIWTEEEMERFAAIAPQRILDGLRLASLTGLRRADLVALRWSEVGDHAIVRTAAKKSRGKRRRAVVPIIDDARKLLDELRTRHRAEGVDHVLVDSLGRPWKPASFSAQFNAIRDSAGIIEPANAELDIAPRKKHLHDVRGTFCTHLCRTNLTDEEIGRVMAWSPDTVANIRRVYVDDSATVVALAKRIGSSTVKQPVKRYAGNRPK